eukprot:3719813-Lingulodinium_polyedra.AAC.1
MEDGGANARYCSHGKLPCRTPIKHLREFPQLNRLGCDVTVSPRSMPHVGDARSHSHARSAPPT